MLDSVGGRLSGVGTPITAALAPMHRDMRRTSLHD
jgi:hypothetical protein